MNSEKVAQFVSKLLRDTQEKKLEWVAVNPGTERVAYSCDIEDRALLLLRDPASIRVAYIMKIFKGTEDQPIYSLSGVPGLGDLYDAAAWSAADIDTFIDSVLKSE